MQESLDGALTVAAVIRDSAVCFGVGRPVVLFCLSDGWLVRWDSSSEPAVWRRGLDWTGWCPKWNPWPRDGWQSQSYLWIQAVLEVPAEMPSWLSEAKGKHAQKAQVSLGQCVMLCSFLVSTDVTCREVLDLWIFLLISISPLYSGATPRASVHGKLLTIHARGPSAEPLLLLDSCVCVKYWTPCKDL